MNPGGAHAARTLGISAILPEYLRRRGRNMGVQEDPRRFVYEIQFERMMPALVDDQILMLPEEFHSLAESSCEILLQRVEISRLLTPAEQDRLVEYAMSSGWEDDGAIQRIHIERQHLDKSVEITWRWERKR